MSHIPLESSGDSACGGVRPFSRPATRTLVPAVLLTRVLPALRTWKVVGALMSYQSFLAKGSVQNRA